MNERAECKLAVAGVGCAFELNGAGSKCELALALCLSYTPLSFSCTSLALSVSWPRWLCVHAEHRRAGCELALARAGCELALALRLS